MSKRKSRPAERILDVPNLGMFIYLPEREQKSKNVIFLNEEESKLLYLGDMRELGDWIQDFIFSGLRK